MEKQAQMKNQKTFLSCHSIPPTQQEWNTMLQVLWKMDLLTVKKEILEWMQRQITNLA